MKRSYDLVSGMYDTLANIFLGNALREAQKYYLKNIPANAVILIAGGGTGWIMEEIAKVHNEGLYIDYVDSSAKMIDKAKQRFTGSNTVNFVCKSILYFESNTQYDVILTPFFLDNFNPELLRQVFDFLHEKLKKEALWIHTDFHQNDKKVYWQKALLFMMYSFFRITCNISAERLPDMLSCFKKDTYLLIERKSFFQKFIVSSLYKKL